MVEQTPRRSRSVQRQEDLALAIARLDVLRVSDGPLVDREDGMGEAVRLQHSRIPSATRPQLVHPA